MVYLILIACIIGNVVLSFKLISDEAQNLGKVSSLKLKIKEKEKEIADLKKRIEHFKINDDVEV